MERIRAALEKAQAERKTARVSRRTSVPVGKTDFSSGRSALTSLQSDIQYTQTRVIELNPVILESNRIITHNKDDRRGAAFDVLRTKILQNMARTKSRTLAITSATAANGKTVMSINLAFSIAQNSKNTVLLIDFDLRRPALGKYLGIEHSPSLYDYLEGTAELHETMINPSNPRITIIANDRPIVNAAETLASQKVSDLVAEIRDRYPDRTIIFDLPPLLGIDDSLVILPMMDATMLVVGAGDCSTGELEEAYRLTADHNVLGVVMNKSSAKPADYYYY